MSREEDKLDTAMGRFRVTLESIEHPEKLGRVSGKMQDAAYSIVITELLFLLAVELAMNGGTGVLLRMGVLTTGVGVAAILLASILMLRGVLKAADATLHAISLNTERLDASFLLANSVVFHSSENSESRYREYNLSMFRIMHPGSFSPYALVIGLAVLLYLFQHYVDAETAIDSYLANALFASGTWGLNYLELLCIIPSLYIGVLGMTMSAVSRYGATKWSRMRPEDLYREAEQCRAIVLASPGDEIRDPNLTLEDAINLYRNAESGMHDAIEVISEISRGIDEEITRFNRIRRYYLIAITIIIIIDIVIQFL